MHRRVLLLMIFAAASLRPAVTAAQTTAPATPPPTASASWPTLVLRVGALVADVGSDVRIDSTAGASGTLIELKDDLGFENQTTSFFINGTWRFARRHRLLVEYDGVRRSSTRNVLPRTISFRDRTFTVGSETDAFFDTFYVSTDYGFAFVMRPAVEIGVSIGVTLMRFHTGVGVSLQGGTGTTVSRDLAESTQFDVPVPLPGFFVNIRPHRRLTIVGSARPIKATFGQTTASFVEATGGVDFQISRKVGVGGAYYYNRSTVDREQSTRNGRIVYSFNGPQVYAVFTF